MKLLGAIDKMDEQCYYGFTDSGDKCEYLYDMQLINIFMTTQSDNLDVPSLLQNFSHLHTISEEVDLLVSYVICDVVTTSQYEIVSFASKQG